MNETILNINAAAESWFQIVWNSSWQSGLLVLLLLGVVFAGRKLSAPVRYSILLVALLKFAVPPFFAVPTGVFSALPESQSIVRSVEPIQPVEESSAFQERLPDERNLARTGVGNQNRIEMGSSFVDPISPMPNRPKNVTIDNILDDKEIDREPIETTSKSPALIQDSTMTRLSLKAWLMLGHLIGCCWLIGIVLFKLRKLSGLEKRSVAVTDEQVIRSYRRICGLLGFRSNPQLLVSTEIDGPVSFGCIRPTVILPQELIGNQSFESAAIAHELSHLKRFDPWVNWAQNLLFVAWWINPMIWILNAQIRKIREDCCDDLVLAKQLANEASYSESLIEIAKISDNKFAGNVSTAFGMADHPLAGRIRRIMNPGIRRRTGVSLAGGVLVLALGVVCLPGIRNAIAETRNSISAGDESATELESTNDDSIDENQETPAAAAASSDQTAEKSQDGFKSGFKFKVVDSGGRAIEGAQVFANTSGVDLETDKPKVVNNTYHTDANGVADIELFDGSDGLRTWTSKEGFVTLFAPWDHRNQDEVPDLFTVTLQPGTTIGGRVLDSNGKAIKGAKVEVRRSGGGMKVDTNDRTRLGTWLSNGDDAVVSDDNGAWEVNNVPAGDDLTFSFKVTHPDYIFDRRWQSMGHFGVTLEQLREGIAEYSLEKGLIVSGVVVDSDSNPVADALIVWGDRPYWEEGSQETKTDENGLFVTQAQAPGDLRLTVVAKDWMPQSRTVTIKPDNNPSLSFQLSPGKKLHLKIIDENDNPLPESYVSIKSWRGAEALYNTRHPNVMNSQIPNHTRETGEYIWKWAPDDAVELVVSNRKLQVSKVITVTADDTIQTVMLKKPFVFAGSVIDAKTKKPVTENYTITPVTFASAAASARGIAQSHQKKKFTSAEFKVGDAFRSQNQNQVAFRIDAIGYKTFTTERFSYESPSDVQKILLEPTTVRTARILDEHGKPVIGARSWIVLPRDSMMINRDADYFSDIDGPPIKSNEQGIVRFSTPTTNHAVVAVTQDGYAEKYLSPDEKAGDLKLQPWSSVNGQLFQAGKPVGGATIIARPIRALGGDNPHVQDIFRATTAADGAFEFKRLPPVPTKITSVLSSWRDYPITSNQAIPLDLKPGESYTVKLGGEGLQVKGQVKLNGDGADLIQFRYGINYLVSNHQKIEVPKHSTNRGEFDTGEQKSYDQKLWQDLKTQDGKESWYFKLNEDGSFLINGVPSGDYRFLVKIYEPPEGCLVDPVGYGFLEIATSDYETSGGELDLGTIEIDLKDIPKEGDVLTDFRYEDLQGKSHRISEHRGKFVLLDFWATWCQPCVASLPDVQELYQEIADSSDAMILSVSLDDKKDKVAALVKAKKLEWEQGIVGDIQQHNSARSLGISSVPLYILLDPEGKIVHRSYSFADAAKSLKEKVGKTID